MANRHNNHLAFHFGLLKCLCLLTQRQVYVWSESISFLRKKGSNTHIEYEELDHETDDGLLACSKASSFNDDFSLLSIILISFITTFLSHLIFRQISPQVGCFDTLPSSIEDTLYIHDFHDFHFYIKLQ